MIHRQVALLAAVVGFTIACAPPSPPRFEARGPEVQLSLLALGDWGRDPRGGITQAKQFRVAEVLAEQDRSAPADAVLFLGDNFYPHGLVADEVVSRVRLNLVMPYCHFIALTERGDSALGESCLEPQTRRHTVPLWAVLGNHDHSSGESVDLQRERVDDFVSNWRLVGVPVETVELPQGVSLVFYDSTPMLTPAGADALPLLTNALRESRGPWRILVAHHPLDGRDVDQGIERAIAAAGVRAQLLLAGHIHDLRASAPQAPLPAFQLVSGGGGGDESNHKTLPGELWKLASTGFARIDLVGRGDRARLRLRVFAVSAVSVPQVVAAWTLGPDGAISTETLGPAAE